MRELTDRALDVARAKGATYADIRIVRRETQTLEMKNGVMENLSLADTYGFGVRVVADGAWAGLRALAAAVPGPEVVRLAPFAGDGVDRAVAGTDRAASADIFQNIVADERFTDLGRATFLLDVGLILSPEMLEGGCHRIGSTLAQAAQAGG